MTSLVDKRTYLCNLTPPLAKPGRGRFSRVALEALAAAEAAGVRFSDSSTQVGAVPVKGTDGTVRVEQREVNIYAPHPDPIREGRLAFAGEGIKLTVSATEVCCNTDCMLSFGWCYCDTPTFRDWRTGKVLTLVH